MIDNRRLPARLDGLTPIQIKYLQDTKHRFQIVTSGRRSRKSLIGKRKVLQHAIENPNHSYFYAAPTYPQAKGIFWEGLLRDTYYIRKSVNKSELTVILKNGTKIQVFGLQKADRLEGQPWNGGHITEAGTCVTKDIWMENLRPVFSDTKGFCILDGVPEGRNYYFDLALRCWPGGMGEPIANEGAIGFNPENPEWIHYNWFSSDVLDASELEAAKRDMSEKLFKQEYEGAFIDYAGLAYYNFSDDNVKPNKYNPNYPVTIGMDFNVDPMTAVLLHIGYNNQGDKVVYQFGEIYLPNSNTFQMVDEIKDILKLDTPTKIRAVEINPDATGSHSSSNATRSDISILRQAGFKVNARKTNPRQKDRINAVNNMFKSASGKVRYFVDPSCKKTIEDFHKVESLPDGKLDKSAEKAGLVHISDALGYSIYYNFPLLGKDKKIQQ